MDLRPISASEDVIGDPSRPGTNNGELLEPKPVERKKALGKRANFHFNRTGKKITVANGGKKFVFRPKRSSSGGEQKRSAIGNEFQIVGAAKVNERRLFA